MSERSAKWPLAVILASLLCGSVPAHAGTKEECVAAYETTQAARKEGKLLSAREKVIVCSQDACPGFVKTDCIQWMTEIEASVPTVVFEVRDAAGAETTAVKVTIDGQPFKDRLDGKAAPVDPGEHTFRYEIPGADAIEEKIVVREGEKNRKLTASFAKGTTVAAPPTTGAPPPDAKESGGAPAIAYVLGGAGVVGVGLFATFALLGTSQKSDLEDLCAPNCTDDQVSPVRTKLLVADISLGVGVVALGVATYLFVTAPSKSAPASAQASAGVRLTGLGAAPLPGGSVGVVRGAF